MIQEELREGRSKHASDRIVHVVYDTERMTPGKGSGTSIGSTRDKGRFAERVHDDCGKATKLNRQPTAPKVTVRKALRV